MADTCDDGVVDVQRVVIEGRQRPDHADQHRHRMRIAAETTEEVLHLLVHHGVAMTALVKSSFCVALGKVPLSSR